MKHRSLIRLWLVPALLLGAFHAPQVAWGEGEKKAATPPTEAATQSPAAEKSTSKWSNTPEQMALRLEAVGTLIEKSTGARRITATGNPEAMALQEQARALLLDARSALKRGDADATKKLLSQASQAMFQAMRKADGGASGVRKQANDFKRRLESVRVLLTAHQRISTEKKQGEATSVKIQKTLDHALQLQAKGDFVAARAKLDEAYILAKLGIEQMRRGDTLVRSLHFESPEEEYHYEIDRNDTHRMLVSMLLKSKPDSTKKMAAKFVAKSEAIRKEAEALAAKGQFAEAIAALEKSTKELVRAIRSAGVYIPG